MKASQCGNDRQERSDRRKAGRKGSGKNVINTQSILFNNKSVLAQNNEEQKNLMNNNKQHQESNLCYLLLRGIFLTRRIWELAIYHFLTLILLFLYHCRTANSKKWIIFFTLQRSRTLDRDQTRKSEVVFFLSDRFVLKAQLGKVFIRCSSIHMLGRGIEFYRAR